MSSIITAKFRLTSDKSLEPEKCQIIGQKIIRSNVSDSDIVPEYETIFTIVSHKTGNIHTLEEKYLFDIDVFVPIE